MVYTGVYIVYVYILSMGIFTNMIQNCKIYTVKSTLTKHFWGKIRDIRKNHACQDAFFKILLCYPFPF